MKGFLNKARFAVLAAIAFVSAALPFGAFAEAVARIYGATHDFVTKQPQVFATLHANTLTGLITTIYNALDVVSRELVGFIPSVSTDAQYSRAAVGQTVTSPSTRPSAARDVTAAATRPNDGDQTIDPVSMSITKSRAVPVRWNGEEKLALDNNGAQYNVILRDQFAQAMRTLTNEVEADLAALHIHASRAYGTVGTIPFTTNTAESAQLRKILSDNGAPMSQLRMVITTGVGASMRTLMQLNKANEAGTDFTLRRGTLLDLHGMAIRETGQTPSHTAGTAASSTTNTAGYAVGATVITLASAGTGTFVAGDAVSFAGDSRKYMLTAGDADVSGGGTITLAAPGLRQAIPALATAITRVASSERSLAFAQSAIALATRLPALPPGGRDLAIDRMTVTDPVSGLSFEVAVYPEYRQIAYEVSLAWGVKAVKPEHIAALISS